ncbi:hypothetical protein [Microlunatus parietis]|uniref:Uncharacterized protein n=1 Tax=Microlunatus parietis TaxID=682979 RepID=A0A7Y9I9B9_9ACTN|nr:hypothetical protein [Microlunatus parietis]NYE72650.1 hypothetical protein [Microlunatus parietis]
MRGPAGLIGALVIMVLSVIMSAACTVEPPRVQLPPPDTYRPQDPVGEDSVARPVPPGTAETITAPLVAAGAFCAQVRSNAHGRALWCRHRDADDPWVAQFLLDDQDRLAWAWFPSQPQPEEPDPNRASDPERLAGLAGPSLGALWPETADRFGDELTRYDHDHRDLIERGRSVEGAFTRSWRDDHADYTMSSVDGLIMEARDVEVERWPSDAAHYASRMSVAVGDLQDSGFECFYPPQVYCRREFQEFRVSLRGDRIITADFVVAGDETLAEVFPRGLTFLSPAVRSAVGAKIEEARKARQDYLGIVEGTVLAVDAAPIPPVGGPVPITVRIGAPLAGAYPI